MENIHNQPKIHPNSFKKPEHLCSDKQIEDLFKNGQTSFAYPIKMYYIQVEDCNFNKVVFSAPKKKFKRAVKRNLLKRQMREAYRMNKPKTIYKYNLAFVYLEKSTIDYWKIVSGMKKLLGQLK